MAVKDINAVMGGWKDRGPWIYYDTVQITFGAALASSYSPFSVPMGGTDPITTTTKTKLQTNMIASNNFGSSRCLVLEQFGFYFPSGFDKVDIDKILAACYIEFKIEDKIYYEGRLEFFPSGTGLRGVTAVSTHQTWTLGTPTPRSARRYGAYSKYIAPLQLFSLILYFPGTPPTLSGTATSGTGPMLIPILDGLTDRSVQ